MDKVISQDGTAIAYDRIGQGPAMILIGAGPTDRSANAPLAELLAKDLTVYNYDRRGRGDSGDTAPYAVDREFEDIEALITAAGGSAHLYGTSGGGIIALEAAARGLAVDRLAVWEVPYILPGTRTPVPADYREQLVALLAEGRRGDMCELFLTAAVGIPAEFVAPMRDFPGWPAMEAVAHTLIYDATITGDFSLPADRLTGVTAPTLVIDGETIPWISSTAQAVADLLPDVRRATLTGQPHNVAPEAIAPALAAFFTEATA
ncbi:alpha/beta fold hydrolase [Nonomuraea spiralis]|uniref:Alpha/beta fold hydrolase n=1 Tax=Nonomuraea spiralis TaxID=46182 RepID=A0ABV5IR32_9ACTN|nr:alpha/beta hydrolase [Nonomuraea spiralis]GGT37939.1 alpha/beta hydrolase [Nonomuraea spiralis]